MSAMTNKLPHAARALPEPAQQIFQIAYDAAAKEGDAQEAHRVAWSAVRRSYEKLADGKWEKRANAHLDVVETIVLDDGANVRITNDGYLVAAPRVARTGIQDYRGWEVGKPEKAIVKVFRPEAEVFDGAAVQSLAFKPVTINHPKEMVTAKNWRDLAVGQTGGEVLRDGEFARISMVVMDQKGIDAIQGGKQQLSLGYTAELVDEAGTTDSGEAYDMIQTQIRVNHLAIVAQARGGSQLVIGDAEPEEAPTMTMKTILVDGISVEIPVQAAAIIERDQQRAAENAKRLNDSLVESQTQIGTLQTQLADAKKEVETHKGEIAVLQKQVKDAEITPDKLNDLVKARSTVVEKAKAIVGDALVVEGKSDMEIKRQAVAKHLGDAAMVAALSDEAVNGAFVALKAPAGSGASGATLADHLSGAPRQSFSVGDTANDPAAKAWEARGAKMKDAWKNGGAAA